MKTFLSAALLFSLVSFNLGIEMTYRYDYKGRQSCAAEDFCSHTQNACKYFDDLCGPEAWQRVTTYCDPKIQLRCWFGDFGCLTALNQVNQPALAASIQRAINEKFYTMFVDNLHVDYRGLQLNMNNILVRGLKDAIVDHLSIDPVSKTIRLVFHSDLSFKSRYTTNGFLFGLPIFGDGDIKIDMHNVLTEMAIPYEIIKDLNGQDIVDLKGYKYWFDVKRGPTYRLDNLYYGNEKSSQIMHKLLHDNAKEVTNVYGRFFFDKVNDNIFNAIRSYMHSQPLRALY